MTSFCGLCSFWLLMTALSGQALSPRPGLTLECLGNVMKLTLNRSLSLGRQLEVEVVNGSQVVTLTPALAAQCGYSVESDPWGNMRIYTSLLSCFANNHGDAVFDIGLRLQFYGNRMSDDVHDVEKTCEYNRWASREILCERNFMEVSVNRGHNNLNLPMKTMEGFSTDQTASASLSDIWRMVFYTPEEKLMMLEEVQDAGYGVMMTPTRLVLRSAHNTSESFTMDVNGMLMEVFKASTYIRQAWSVVVIDSVAVCPRGGLHFTNEVITWHMPLYIMPLMTDPNYQILEIYMGINGKRLNQAQMMAGGYTMVVTEPQIIISLPVGGPDGYYKSNVLDDKYHVTYSIEPMLEMLWLERQSELTRYKVHYPILTPPEPRSPHITDNTVADQQVFKLMLGFFLPDVELQNVTLCTEVMSVDVAKARGYNVQEHVFNNGSKAFSIAVPFSDPAVLRRNVDSNIIYSLSLTFGLLVLPEYLPFSHSASVEATHRDITTVDMYGVCDQKNFYITIEHWSQEDTNDQPGFNMRVGRRELSAELYEEYRVEENCTHINMIIPYLAQDVVFEKARNSSLRAHIDVDLSYNNWQFKNFSLACTFPLIMTECFPDGSITALVVMVESDTWALPSQLILRDPSCKPAFSNNRFAFFSFKANSCQTFRTFSNGIMTYQNEISVANRASLAQPLQNQSKRDPEYRVAVVCNYNQSQALPATLSVEQQVIELHAVPGVGELHVRMRLARDASYEDFYMDDEYPVVQYLKNPLFFEVELMKSDDPQIELVLENCWASADYRGSTLSWDLIVNGCVNPADRYQIKFYPVTADERVRYPSHVRRFKFNMFAFVQDAMPLHDQILVRCETVLCGVHQNDDVCKRRCPVSEPNRGRRNVTREQDRMWVWSGNAVFSGL